MLSIAALLGACQSDTTQDGQQTEPELPEAELTVEEPWVRPASSGDSTALYATVANGQSTADTLMGAQRAPIYESVEIFAPSDTPDMSQMQPVDSLIIPPNSRMSLTPDSAHLVLNGVDQDLEDGGTFLVTLEFAQGGLQQVQAEVSTSPPSSEQ